MLISLRLDFSVFQLDFSDFCFLWLRWTIAFLKSLGKVPTVKQKLIFLCRKPTKRLGNCFIIFVVISLFWAGFFMSRHYISLDISSTVTHVKEKLVSFLTLDNHLINNRNNKIFLVYLNSLFNRIRNFRNIVEILLVNFDSKIWYYIKKESIKMFAISYSFLINRSLSFSVI